MSVKVCQLYKASEKMKAAVYISTEPECYLSGQAKFSASLFSATTDGLLAVVSGFIYVFIYFLHIHFYLC